MKENMMENMMEKKLCGAFLMEDANTAAEHIGENWEPVEDYGDYAYGHWLHVWDEGGRRLGRCKACGAYILRQKSEYHGWEDDDYYTDWFPVADAAEADELNRLYGGYELERNYPGRYLMRTNSVYGWSRRPEGEASE